jgi:hypothetical protein
MFIQTEDISVVEANTSVTETAVVTELVGSPADFMYINNEIVLLPPKPTIYHQFNYDTLQWQDTRTVETQWNIVRNRRNNLLQESDWTDTFSAPTRLGQELYDQWQEYRQKLRDVTTQTDPFNITWPTPP